MARNKDKPFNNPFAAVGKDLKKQIIKANKAEKNAKAASYARPPAPAPVSESTLDDGDLFLRAMGGIKPIDDRRGVVEKPLPRPDAAAVPVFDEEAEALAELASLVDGTGELDISDTDEFIEGCRADLDRRILSKLKRGDYAFRDHIDLHGMTRDVARDAVVRFIIDSQRNNQRCVLIVHGRGLNSKDNIPVLKVALKRWFERGRISKNILAFCTARPHDGGAGAVYVLLKR